MTWLLVAPVVAALVLVVIGAIVLLTEARALQWKVESLEPPALNPYRFRRAFEQLKKDIDAARALLDRAHVAMLQINVGFAELSQSPLARLFRSRGS